MVGSDRPPGPGASVAGAASAGEGRSRGARVRSWLRTWHRDVGYLCAGLVVVYAVSGVAVNHHHEWDYNLGTGVT